MTTAQSLGEHQAAVNAALEELRDGRVVGRIWAHDHTVWKPEPDEISNRLGWLRSPEVMMEALEEKATFVDAVRADGYTHALLLGMGGSSLAPEDFPLMRHLHEVVSLDEPLNMPWDTFLGGKA